MEGAGGFQDSASMTDARREYEEALAAYYAAQERLDQAPRRSQERPERWPAGFANERDQQNACMAEPLVRCMVRGAG